MSILETILFHAWYGSLRRPVRAIIRRLLPGGNSILCGPLKGLRFEGHEITCRLGIYELHVQHALQEILRPGEVVYDLGANNGYLSLLAAQCVGDQGRVYSFEPLPRNIDRISALIKLNLFNNQETIPMAVSNQSGRMQFYFDDEADSYTPSLMRGRRTSEITVKVTTLNEFAATHRSPNLIKMDVEGAEALVLEGAGSLLADNPPRTWLIEVHNAELDGKVRNVLSGNDYRISPLIIPHARKDYPHHLIATK